MSKTTELIRRLREAHKLTQAEIVLRTGIPQPRLSRWARGETPAGAEDALKIAALVDQLDQSAKKTRKPERAEGTV